MKQSIIAILLASALLFVSGCASATGSLAGQNAKGATKAETAKEISTVKVGGLKGATSMGLVNMMSSNDRYEFTMATAADELLPLIIKGDLDIALLPVNAAAILYNKTEGKVKVIDVNTLGVLYIVTADDSIQSLDNLAGKSVYLTGKGTVVEYAFKYLLDKCGVLNDVTLEFKSEPTEVAAILAKDENAIGLLPQPFVTAACMQNDKLKKAFGLNEKWLEYADGNDTQMVTGVTVVRSDFLSAHPESVHDFLADHKASVNTINEDPSGSASLCVDAGIVAKEAIAKEAIPDCNIVSIDGEQMKDMVSEYLEILYNSDAACVGGNLPGEDFYYINN